MEEVLEEAGSPIEDPAITEVVESIHQGTQKKQLQKQRSENFPT